MYISGCKEIQNFISEFNIYDQYTLEEETGNTMKILSTKSASLELSQDENKEVEK